MAVSAAALPAGRFAIGNKKVRMVDLTLTGSYATGGEAVAPGDVGMKKILQVFGIVTEASGATTAWVPYWDRANSKLKLFGAAVGATGATEHAAAAYAASTVGHLMFVGE